jgi:hypothetical protein
LKKPRKPRKIDFVMYSFQFESKLNGCPLGTGKAWTRVNDNHDAIGVT